MNSKFFDQITIITFEWYLYYWF